MDKLKERSTLKLYVGAKLLTVQALAVCGISMHLVRINKILDTVPVVSGLLGSMEAEAFNDNFSRHDTDLEDSIFGIFSPIRYTLSGTVDKGAAEIVSYLKGDADKQTMHNWFANSSQYYALDGTWSDFFESVKEDFSDIYKASRSTEKVLLGDGSQCFDLGEKIDDHLYELGLRKEYGES